MDFSDALLAVKLGRKVRRAYWEKLGWENVTLELLPAQAVQDGRQAAAQLMIYRPGEGILRSFSGANRDILAEDWEIVE